jgi:hypothetical protein
MGYGHGYGLPDSIPQATQMGNQHVCIVAARRHHFVATDESGDYHRKAAAAAVTSAVETASRC